MKSRSRSSSHIAFFTSHFVVSLTRRHVGGCLYEPDSSWPETRSIRDYKREPRVLADHGAYVLAVSALRQRDELCASIATTVLRRQSWSVAPPVTYMSRRRYVQLFTGVASPRSRTWQIRFCLSILSDDVSCMREREHCGTPMGLRRPVALTNIITVQPVS